jgi:hypothetical protein
VREQLRRWLDDHAEQQPPKSPLGTAIRYALSHWTELGKFLEDARIPLDNNASERALHRVALGRKNYLFVGDVKAGRAYPTRESSPQSEEPIGIALAAARAPPRTRGYGSVNRISGTSMPIEYDVELASGP